MKKFKPCTLDYKQARADLAKFKAFLDKRPYFGERAALRFFKKHSSLIPFMAGGTLVTRKDLMARELNLSGSFTCDFAIGDSAKKAYCFIEFEDAKPNSIFKPGSRALRKWAPRIEGAYSQITDWLWQLEHSRNLPHFEDMFGTRNIEIIGMIVLGRNETLSASERDRLTYRKTKIVIGGCQIIVRTFDDLYEEIRWAVEELPHLQKLN